MWTQHTERSTRRAIWCAAIALLAVAATSLRAITLSESLWLDELHTSWAVTGSFSDVLPRAAEGNQAPLYFLIQWFIVRLLGQHEWSLRLLSLLSGTAFVLGIVWITRRWTHSRSLAWLAGLIACVDPHAIFFAREARPYALLQVLALLYIEATRQRWRHPTVGNRIRIVLLAWLLFFTHYTAALLIVSPWYVLVRRRRYLTDYAQLAVDHLVILCGMLCAWPALRTIGLRRDNWAQFVRPQPLTSLWTLFPCSRYLVPALLSVILAKALGGGKVTTRRRRQVGVVLTSATLVYLMPLVTAWGATQADLARLYFRRYVIVAEIGLFVLAAASGMLLVTRRQRLGHAAIVGVAVAWMTALRMGSSVWQHSHEDWRAAVRIVNDQVSAAQVDGPPLVLLRAGLIEDAQLSLENQDSRLVEYCRFPLAGIYQIRSLSSDHNDDAHVVPLSSRKLADWRAEWQREVDDHGHVWALYRGGQEAAQGQVEHWLGSAKNCTMESYSFDGVTVIHVRAEQP
ncbi:MAG: glycosyltransferase family 39 protein [Planctomycetales bacterium]|nr:glycosyltransferase family 39 protein [Planctomycetales bacterium]